MSAGHIQPAVLHRHHKRVSPARLAARDLFGEIDNIFGSDSKHGDDDDDDDDDDHKKGINAEDFTTTKTTIVQTIALPQTTLLRTEVIPVIVPVQQTATSPPANATPTVSPPVTLSSSSMASSSSSSSSSSSESSSSKLPSSSSSPISVSTPLPAPVKTSAPASHIPNPSLSPSLSASTHPSPSSNAADVSSASAQQHSGLSGGAIGAIVVVSILAAIAVAMFIVRKTLLRRRQNKRMTWSASAFPKLDQDSNMFNEKIGERNLPPVPEKPVMPPPMVLPPPPMSYNNPMNTMSPTLQPALGSPSVALAPAGTNVATVRCTFVPNLPDELSITAGETIRVLSEYDDGWALCANERGEQGVVPVECFERSAVPRPSPGMYLGQGTGDWRMSRRASSLNGAVGGIPRY